MSFFKIEYKEESGILPPFSLTIKDSEISAIYSDSEMQAALLKYFKQQKNITIFNESDGLYERLTVEDNLRFFHKWFASSIPLAEIMVLCKLSGCTKTPLRNCSFSEIQRIRYAKYVMMDPRRIVFIEPIHGVDVETINVFMELLAYFSANGTASLLVVSNMEHALLLGDSAFKLQEKTFSPIEIETEDKQEEKTMSSSPVVADLFKVTAKLADKMILFDPTEIDYIESQDGKALIVIEKESFVMDSTLADIEKRLEIYGFYRCHRSYIVNLQKVREIITWSKNTYSLRLNNKSKSTIPLSRTKVQTIQEMFNLK